MRPKRTMSNIHRTNMCADLTVIFPNTTGFPGCLALAFSVLITYAFQFGSIQFVHLHCAALTAQTVRCQITSVGQTEQPMMAHVLRDDDEEGHPL